MMIARFQCNVESRARGRRTRLADRHDLGVLSAVLGVEPLADDHSTPNDHGTHQGIGGYTSPATMGDFQGAVHELRIWTLCYGTGHAGLSRRTAPEPSRISPHTNPGAPSAATLSRTSLTDSGRTMAIIPTPMFRVSYRSS